MNINKYLFSISLAIVIILGFIDYITGYEYSFFIFYLIPIMLICWFEKELGGIIISFFSALVWLTADLLSGHIYSNHFIPIWNAFVRFAGFVIIVKLIGKIKKDYDYEKNIARVDMLTGLYNLRALTEYFNIEKNRSSRSKKKFSLAYIDLDNFKLINDKYGHAKGDNLLANIGRVIKSNIRQYDFPARIGGDEFIILFPETDSQQAEAVMTKLASCIKEILKEQYDILSFSAGVITVSGYEYSFEEIIKAADNLMYTVKKNNKDGVAYSQLN